MLSRKRQRYAASGNTPRLTHLHLLRLRVEPRVGLAQGQAVDDLQEGQGAGLDDVGADATAADALALVLGLDEGLALGVLADRHAAHLVLAHRRLVAGDALDGL